MRLKCKFGIHKYKDIETSTTKNVSFGFAGCESPGMRVKQKCEFCSVERYVSLNLMMPNKYLREEYMWHQTRKTNQKGEQNGSTKNTVRRI